MCSVLSFGCAKKGTSPEAESAQNPDLAAVNPPPESVPPSPAENQTGVVGTETAQAVTDTGPTGVTTSPPTSGTSTAMPQPETLTDDQIAKIAETVDAGEVEQAKIAQKKAKNAKVKKFASHMVQQHTKSKKQTETLATKAQLTPADSTTAQDLSQKSTETCASLESAEATNFDKQYIDAQVQQHESVVLLLDSKLIPNASNADLKARLEETRKLVENHLTEAKEIQSSLASAESTTPTPMR
jgi:putative membrane protein